MFLIDNILLFPARGLLSVFRELHDAVEQEFLKEAETLRAELAELYMMLESGRLSEDAFEQREKELLDRLDEAELRNEQAHEELETDLAAEEEQTGKGMEAEVEEAEAAMACSEGLEVGAAAGS